MAEQAPAAEEAPLLLPPLGEAEEAALSGTSWSWRFPRRSALAAAVALLVVASLLALGGHRLERSALASSRLSGATQLLSEGDGSKVTGQDAEDGGKHGQEVSSGDEKGDAADEDSKQDDSRSGDDKENLAMPSNCTECRQRHGIVKMSHSAAKHLMKGSSQDGAINVSWFGKQETKYFPGGKIVDHGKGVVQVSDAEKGMNMRDASGDYTSIPLAGNSFRLDVDLGNPGASCGCNVAFFLVSMPATKPNAWGNHYCDANCIGGNCCAEFDLLEMNTHSLQATSHPCSDYSKPPFDSQSWACDHIGSPHAKFGNGARDYGPGDDYTINSQKPFEFRMDFPTEHGTLKGIITVSQGSKKITHTMYDIENMRNPLTDGMVLCTSSWESTDLTWLDGGTCHDPETCNRQPAIFSNIVLEKLPDTPAPSPAPSPSPSPSPNPAPSPNNDNTCPGQGYCGCDWAEQWGCGVDDGGECFCRCCCEKNDGKCKWTG